MTRRNGNNGTAPTLTWANIVMTIGTAAVLAGAGWTLFQTQFGYIDKDKESIRLQLGQRISETNSRFDGIEVELRKRRDLFIDQQDFAIYKESVREELRRMVQDLRRAHDDNLPRSEFKVWQEERTKTIDRLIAELDKNTTRVEQVVRDRASVEALLAIQKQIDLIRDQVKELSTREDTRHSKDK